jgi:DNA-binding beta-propeller fold protein YncE
MPGRPGRDRRRGWRKAILLVVLLAILAAAAYTVWFFLRNKTLPLPRLTDANVSILPPPQFLYNISGTGKDSLGRPLGVAVSPDGRIYVSDLTMHRISVFTSDGRFLFDFQKIADGKQKALMSPVHIAFDNKGELWVNDRVLASTYIFSAEGKYLRKFTPKDTNISKLWSPLAITFDKNGRTYFSDVGQEPKHRILVFDAAGNKTAEWGKTSQVTLSTDKPGEFYFPNGIAVAPSGTIFIADGNNRRVQVFDKDGKFQKIVQTSGVPRGIWVDGKNSRLFVTDALAHQVDIFDLKGEKLVTFGSGGSGPGQFQYPNDIALDSAGKIYVADRENHQVQVWGWPQPVVRVPGMAEAQRWAWCLTPLLLLPLLLLLRKREFAVTEDFVDSMASSGDTQAMEHKRVRWVTPLETHGRLAGRVEDGVDLGTLIEGTEHSESDARDIADRMGVELPTAILLAVASRSKRLATEDAEVRKLALLLGLDVYDKAEFLERYGKTDKA